MEPIRVLLVEDHTIVRQGLRALLSGRDGIEVVGEAENGREALEMVKNLSPDVVIMDISMPDLNGIDATRLIRKAYPKTQVLILSMHCSEEYVRPALRAGASGFLVKGSGLSDLIAATRAVARGEVFLSPMAAKILVQESAADAPADLARKPEITPREREILQLVAGGRSSKEIADQLQISVKTVEAHRSRIMEKLAIRDLAGLVRYAIRTGLVSADS